MYILCGEAMMASGSGQIVEASCLRAEIVKKSEHSEYTVQISPKILFKFPPKFCSLLTSVRKRDHIFFSELQNGVQVMIFVAFIIVALVVIYAILFQVTILCPIHFQKVFREINFRCGRKSGWQETA